MDQPLSPEDLEALKSYFDLLDRRLIEEASKGNDNTLDVTIRSELFWASIGEDLPYHPTRLDYELHSTWLSVLLAAQNFESQNPKHDTILRYIVAARELGPLCRELDLEPPENRIVPAKASNGQQLWNDLPYLSQDFFQWWKDKSPTLCTAQRRNLSSFIARLASVGVCGDTLTGCALMLFRDIFEEPRRLTSEDPGLEVPVEELLPAVAAWIEFAYHKLESTVKKSFNEFGDAEIGQVGTLARGGGIHQNGFNNLRSDFWKQRLEEISQSGKVPEAAIVLRMIHESREGVDDE